MILSLIWFLWQVGLLGMKNVHIKHLAGNILVKVSESLVESVCCVRLPHFEILECCIFQLSYSLICFLREVNGMSSFVCFVDVCA